MGNGISEFIVIVITFTLTLVSYITYSSPSSIMFTLLILGNRVDFTSAYDIRYPTLSSEFIPWVYTLLSSVYIFRDGSQDMYLCRDIYHRELLYSLQSY
jgi:hypothetical protein